MAKGREDDLTKQVLYEMLCEDVGRSALDSGGIPQYDANGNYTGSRQGYGRHFERNQNRDFEKGPASWAHFSSCKDGQRRRLSVEYTKSVYHFCRSVLEFHPEMDALYQEFAAGSQDYDLGDMEKFTGGRHLFRYLLWKAGLLKPLVLLAEDGDEVPWNQDFQAYRNSPNRNLQELLKDLKASWKEQRDHLLTWAELTQYQEEHPQALSEFEWDLLQDLYQSDGQFSGLYGEDSPVGENTANRETSLSQVLQFTLFTTRSESFVLLQIHGGADYRGGYTRPRVFSGDEMIFLSNDGSIHMMCSKEQLPPGAPAFWTTDDGYHWYPDSGGRDVKQLNDMEVYNLDDLDEAELPEDLRELKEALDKSAFQVAEMCRLQPDKAEHYQRTAQQNALILNKEYLEKLLEWLEESEEFIAEDTIVLDGHDAYYRGVRLEAG